MCRQNCPVRRQMRTHKLNLQGKFSKVLKRDGNTFYSPPLPTLKHSISLFVAPLTRYQCFNRLNLGCLTHASENSLNRNV